jgi:serine/threonine protein kinase
MFKLSYSNTDFLIIFLGDFGMCRNVHTEASLTDSLTSNVGTYIYMAPEVKAGHYSYQADLYSLGLIIWEVVQLIEASKKTNLFYQLLDEQMEDVVQESKILVGVRKLIIDLTKRSIRHRMQSMDDVLAVSSHWGKKSKFLNDIFTQSAQNMASKRISKIQNFISHL